MSKRIPKTGWIIVVALSCLALVIFPACGGGVGVSIPYKNDGDFVQETIGGLNSLDPAWAYDTASGEQIQYMYDTLLFYDGDKTDQFVPMLATNWTVVNDTQIRFCIRDGVHFWNGDNLTAEDVEYSIERAMVQNRAGGPTWMFYMPLLDRMGSRSGGNITVNFTQIDNAVQVDGNCVVFNFVRPFPTTPFLQILCNTWAAIVDKDWCVAHGDWDGTATNWTAYNNPPKSKSPLYKGAMGTGPWKLDTWDPIAGYIRLVKNTDYWQGSVPFNMVTTKFVDEWTSRKLSLLNGDADLVYVPRNYIGELAGITDINAIKDLPELTVDAFFFNQNIGTSSAYIGSGALDGNGIPTDFFTDINVRKGFNYAFDWDTYIADAMQGEATQVGSPVIDGLLYYNPDAAKYSYNLTKATECLQAAWNGTVWANGFKFTLCYNTGNIPRKTACEILRTNLYAINHKFLITILPITWDTFLDKIFTPTGVSDLPMFQIGWQADYPDPDNFVTPFMDSEGDFAYYTGYNNPAVDALIDEARIETNTTTRQADYYSLQQTYYDDAPGIMLVQPLGRRFFTKYVHGFYFNPIIPGLPGPLYYMSKSSS
jgi:peptide/nickel transport system substrate-binding protein